MDAPYEGAFASQVIGRNLETLGPFASATAGPSGWRAGPGGLLQGRFGWGNLDSGYVLNSPQNSTDCLGIVVPLQSVNGANGGVIGGPARFGGPQAAWMWQTWDRLERTWRLREGIVTTLMASGNFWLRFAGGANYGDTVYALLSDGSAISGAMTGAALTPWKVCGNVGAGELAIVSSTAKF